MNSQILLFLYIFTNSKVNHSSPYYYENKTRVAPPFKDNFRNTWTPREMNYKNFGNEFSRSFMIGKFVKSFQSQVKPKRIRLGSLGKLI